MALTGNDLLVYIWFEDVQTELWIPIGCTKSHEIEVDGEMIEVTSPLNGKWREHIDGRKGWSISVSYLVLKNEQVLDLLKVGQKLHLSFCPRNDQEHGVEGDALLRTCNIRATKGSLVQGSFRFLGTGELAAGEE